MTPQKVDKTAEEFYTATKVHLVQHKARELGMKVVDCSRVVCVSCSGGECIMELEALVGHQGTFRSIKAISFGRMAELAGFNMDGDANDDLYDALNILMPRSGWMFEVPNEWTDGSFTAILFDY